MKINYDEWKEFQLQDLFKIEAGKYYYTDEYDEGNTPYCSASANNNGIAKYINLDPDFSGNKIITGKVGCNAFYQPEPFCATSDVNILTPKFNMNQYIALFLVTIINKSQNFRWCYGRQCRIGNTKRIKINLPVLRDKNNHPVIDKKIGYSNEGFVPDWKWMEEYIKSLSYKPITTKNINNNFDFNKRKWSNFKFDNLVNQIYKAKSHARIDLEIFNKAGNNLIPFISRTSNNNSVDCFVNRNDVEEIESGNAIVIGDTTATVSYQPSDFTTGDHIVVIRADWLNLYTGLFIVTLLRKESFRYNYGRAFRMDSIKNTYLKLPVTINGDPDWKWIELYMKSLSYGDRINQ